MRLLLVEDARLIREPLSRALELTGWEVEAVPDGEAALARLAVAPVDAVVLDIMLPGKDGLSVLSELRARGDATPSSCSRPAVTCAIACAAWTSARTTILPSPSMSRSFWRGCAPFSDGAAARIRPQ